MNLIIHFAESEWATPARVGGKGANLSALTAAGFPVPVGFVVTAEAYDQFLAAETWIDAGISTLDYAHPDRLREQCQAIRRRLTAARLPQAVGQAILNALAKLEPPNGQEGGAFAVRSSSTFEDLAQAAFAGQHDTYLNVRGSERICERVRACFASLWEDRAVLYRHHQGFSQRQAKMAVVVQRQIVAESAGVGFSIDPITGRMDRMRIAANFGLGESVVSGEGEIDHFDVDKISLEIVGRAIGHKQSRIVAVGGDVERQSVPADQIDAPCLTDRQIASVAELMRQVEAHYGWPQDIEWAFAGDRLHLLQSRPVTTLPPEWTRDESAERFPNAMTPLSWDFIRTAFGVSLRHSLALMGFPALKGDWFEIHDHYIYGNQNAVRLIAMFRPLRARSAAELIEEIPALRRRFAWVMDLPVFWARDLDRYLLRLGQLQARPEPKSLQEAWQFVVDILATAEDYFRPNIAISMTQSGLYRMLHGLISMIAGPARAPQILDGLIAGCETKTAIVNREIHDLATLAAANSALAGELADCGGKAFWDADRLSKYPALADRFATFISDHGHREVDMDYRVLTWSEQPWIVLDAVALLLRAPLSENPTEGMRTQRIRQIEAEQEFLAQVPEELRFFFRELIRLTRTYTILDDLEHYQTTRVNPLARRAALVLGEFLRDAGALAEADDVFFLSKDDVEAAVADGSEQMFCRLREKSLATKASFVVAAGKSPDWSYGKSPIAPAVVGAGDVLTGLAASAGCATGPCFRVRGPEDFARFPAGAILVARTTNPAWTPLFYAARAVITESGGPLSHGAVTARELGLPAVMSVRGIMELVAEGQEVSVNGSAGTVTLIGRPVSHSHQNS
ncbi:MAG TPA: PEP/pyruvate-binding domain-containing protein [Tepidisphaeraceae bacterium]|jgi:pyruvate,water dikinase|nr:PEP/pyruvate-binding domain-containing protein [Tepidisphaeraceae bacterium]